MSVIDFPSIIVLAVFRARPTVNTAGTILNGNSTEVNENTTESCVKILAHGRNMWTACAAGRSVNKRFWKGAVDGVHVICLL